MDLFMLLMGVKSELYIIPFSRHNLQLFYIFLNKKLAVVEDKWVKSE